MYKYISVSGYGLQADFYANYKIEECIYFQQFTFYIEFFFFCYFRTSHTFSDSSLLLDSHTSHLFLIGLCMFAVYIYAFLATLSLSFNLYVCLTLPYSQLGSYWTGHISMLNRRL